jgi:hypothetical protein
VKIKPPGAVVVPVARLGVLASSQRIAASKPEKRMKSLSILACVLFLGGCSEAPVIDSATTGHSATTGYRSSFNGYRYQLYQFGPTSVDDPRMRQPSFYMDGDDSVPWLKALPQNNR